MPCPLSTESGLLDKRPYRIDELVRPEVRALSTYHVQNARGLVKLDAMENPYAWPEEMVTRWLDRLKSAEPNRYPDPACQQLKALLRTSGKIPDGAELLLGNGSDEIIQILLMALSPGACVMAPEPTFVMYRQIARSLGLPFVGVPLRAEDFELDGDVMLRAIDEHDPAILFFAYPNNPTGNLFSRDLIHAVMQRSRGLIILDEAYAPYANDSFMAEVGTHPNLLVMRTLSKLGLAGLRLGYIAGPPAWIEQLDKIRLPYNINVLTQLSAEFALTEQAELDAQVARILADRGWLMQQLAQTKGVRVYPSQANFVLIRLTDGDATAVFEKMKALGVLIKNLDPQGGALKGVLRITVGTPEENERFMLAFRTATRA